MQNRWFGDKNDYLKYSVIRHLLVNGLDVSLQLDAQSRRQGSESCHHQVFERP